MINISQNNSDSTPYAARKSPKPLNFYCNAPKATTVQLTGDFNHWHPFTMQRQVDGCWFAQVQLHHGHHQYKFIVDGQPTLDPRATGIARDEQNDRVSLIAVS